MSDILGVFFHCFDNSFLFIRATKRCWVFFSFYLTFVFLFKACGQSGKWGQLDDSRTWKFDLTRLLPICIKVTDIGANKSWKSRVGKLTCLLCLTQHLICNGFNFKYYVEIKEPKVYDYMTVHKYMNKMEVPKFCNIIDKKMLFILVLPFKKRLAFF